MVKPSPKGYPDLSSIFLALGDVWNICLYVIHGACERKKIDQMLQQAIAATGHGRADLLEILFEFVGQRPFMVDCSHLLPESQ